MTKTKPERLSRDKLRECMQSVVLRHGLTFGLPIPVPGLTMIFQSKFPKAAAEDIRAILRGMRGEPEEEEKPSPPEEDFESPLDELPPPPRSRVVQMIGEDKADKMVEHWPELMKVARLMTAGIVTKNNWLDKRSQRRIFIEEALLSLQAKKFLSIPDLPIKRKGDTQQDLRLEHTLNTMRAHEAWSIEAEERSLTKLKTELTDEQYKSYVLTGMFYEDSKRSHVRYVFRKLRPTIALRIRMERRKTLYRYLAALCTHMDGYFHPSWAGFACPTDDVLHHLYWMRADEHTYWKISVQHPLEEAQSGI